MRLTEEQANIVAENHSLIYWYIHLARLDIEEWYDLLAIELCYTVQKYDESKGSLGNYFKLRADGLVYKEYRKSQAKKRLSQSVQFFDNIDYLESPDISDDNMNFQEAVSGEHGEILKMKYEGYTQTEIAEVLGVSQSHISKILKKVRKTYNAND